MSRRSECRNRQIDGLINTIMKRETIVVAMSGGVDSSAAAALLKEQGHDVIGITLQIWQESKNETKGAGCCSLGAVEDARRVASRLDIPFYVLNYRDPFQEKVIDPFIDAYKRGRTPNPCINCNRYIKFDALLNKALALGAEKLATGHYARVFYDESIGRYALAKACNSDKDQTYALYATTQQELAHMIMPLGEVASKEETRAIARRYNLLTANKPESQEICFVQDRNYTEFLAEVAPEIVAPGAIVDSSGKVRGSHEGVAFFTVGQRKRIGVTSPTPLYVLQVNAADNTVVVGSDAELFSPGCHVEDLTWVSMDRPPVGLEVACQVKVRYNMNVVPARFSRNTDETVNVIFDDPVRAVTPGQAAVFYGSSPNEDLVLGGGTINRPLS